MEVKQLNILDNMKRFSIFTIPFLVLIACQNTTHNRSFVAQKMNYYDSIENINLKLLDSFNLKQYNDSAKWILYTFHCTDTTKQNNEFIPLSALPARLVYISKVNDTLDLLYSFMKNDSTPINKYYEENITDGIQFRTSDNKLLGLIHGEGVVWEKGPFSRYENPLQPEVITYIKNNKEKLNPWFKEEAKRRKIIP